MLQTATGPPIVTHLFSDEKKRTKGLSLLIMCGPLGMVTGMILGALLVGRYLHTYMPTLLLILVSRIFNRMAGALLASPCYEWVPMYRWLLLDSDLP